MARPVGSYSFLPYLRIGLANRITQPHGDPVRLRAGFDLELRLDAVPAGGGAPVSRPIRRPVQLYGPGDIVGIDSRALFKTEPRHWITNFESNYLPYVDFYEEDFPWRYTPARADAAAHRLRPWIALVVLEESEFADGANLKGKPLPYIEVAAAASKFPPADQLWAWAHVHVNRDLAGAEEEVLSTDQGAILPKLDAALRDNADLAYSRLLCPRKLKPNTAYHAFVIPAFETGRLAGLGRDVASAFATEAAWGRNPGQTEFPYYHRWFFRTGIEGDFEYLVRLLKAKPADDRVGRRDLDVQQPGWNLPGLDKDGELKGILRLGGALRVPLDVIKNLPEFHKYEDWAKLGYPKPVQRSIANFLNLADDYQKPGPNPQPVSDPDDALDPDPLITPPLYGRWHAAVDRLLTAADGSAVPNERNWIHELNIDPRFRVAAGYGTRVVQTNQESYVHSAWTQVGDVLSVNRFIRQVNLMGETLWRWHSVQLQPTLAVQPDKFLLLTAPVQKRILVERETVAHRFKTSLVPPVVLSPQMRRLMRPRGRIVTRLGFAADESPQSVVTRLNAGEIVPAAPKIVPPALQDEDRLGAAVQPPPRPAWLANLLRAFPWLPTAFLAAGAILVLLALLLLPFPVGVAVGLAVAGGAWAGWRAMRRIVAELNRPRIFGGGARTPATVDAAPNSPDFRLSTPDSPFTPQPGAGDSGEAARFKSALRDVYRADMLAREAAALPAKRPLDLRRIGAETAAALRPDRSVPRLVLDRLLLPERLHDRFQPEAIDEIMNYPRFDLPMYKPLAELGTEYFLPNINLIEPNSITLLETNQKFIESYMVGLNHEMARELLWREYPTDQRGSYFRQFWDVSGYLPGPDEDLADLAERLKDIPELHTWPATGELGKNDHRNSAGGQKAELVLVIRGELLKRYPTAVIYAHKARWQMKKAPDGSDTDQIDNSKERDVADIPAGLEDRPPRTIVKTPLYSAKIEPDIYFFGFDLAADEAKGSDGSKPGDENRPGWFFVIKERPGEPRFGLDLGGPNPVKHTWQQLAWEDAAPDLDDGGFLEIIPTTPPIDLTAPTDTSQAEHEEELEQFGEDSKVRWGAASDAADLAYILYQVPVLVAVHAAEMLKIK